MVIWIKALYWRLRIVHLSLRWLRRFNLGDAVWFRGEVWRLSQGVKKPLWTLRKGEEAVEANEREFSKVRRPSNFLGSFLSGYRFYMTNWYSIWMRDGIQPWMHCRGVMGR